MKTHIPLLYCIFLIVGITSAIGQESNGSRPVSATIAIKSMDEVEPDSMFLYVYTRSTELYEPDYEFSKAQNEDGEFKFVIKGIMQPIYISLYREGRSNGFPKFLLQYFLVEPGDDVTVNMTEDKLRQQGIGRRINDNYFSPYGAFDKHNTSVAQYYWAKFSFTGKGSEKYSLRYAMDTILHNKYSTASPVDLSGKFKETNANDTLRSIILEMLEQKKNDLSTAAYQIMKTDLIANMEYLQLDYGLKFLLYIHSRDTAYLRNIAETYPIKLRKLNINTAEKAKTISIHYAKFLVKYLYLCRVQSMLDKTNMVRNVDRYIDTINVRYTGELKDRLLYHLIKTGYQRLMGSEGVINKARSYMQTTHYRNRLDKEINNFAKGRDGFNFDLPDATGKRVRFSDFKGKVVFVDFWFTGCTACPKYYKETVSPVEKAFANNKDVVFISIATDNTKDLWLKSIKSGIYTNEHIINLYTDGMAFDHPLCKYYDIKGAPRPILFGRDGKVFSYSYIQLRGNKVEGLTKQIEAALKEGK